MKADVPDVSVQTDETQPVLKIVAGKEYTPAPHRRDFGARIRVDAVHHGRFSATVTRSKGPGMMGHMVDGTHSDLVAPAPDEPRHLSSDLEQQYRKIMSGIEDEQQSGSFKN